jgi:hypothetical protein
LAMNNEPESAFSKLFVVPKIILFDTIVFPLEGCGQ